MSKVQRNEKKKLSANFVNNIAVALFVAGGFPAYLKIIDLFRNRTVSNLNEFIAIPDVRAIVYSSLLWFAVFFVVAIVVHCCARAILRGIED